MTQFCKDINTFKSESFSKKEQIFHNAGRDVNDLLYRHKQPKLTLLKGEIHIWCIQIDKFLPQFDLLFKKISIDEKKRADRFYMDQDKKRYILCRGILRSIISFYLKIEADQLQFCNGKYGKPILISDSVPKEFKFNISHSNGIALFAFVRCGEVGIDVEYVRDIPEMELIVERIFSEKERKVFYSLPENSKRAFFFNIWNRKESLLKGLGDGLYQPPEKFDVLSETIAIPKTIAGSSKITEQWRIGELQFSPAYVAAYAVNAPSDLCCYKT